MTPPAPGLSPDAVTAWGQWLTAIAPFVTPMIGGFIGWLFGRKERVAKIKAIEKQIKQDAEEEATAVIDAITRRFQTLLDGYEARVKDLMEEIKSLRTEVRLLRVDLTQAPEESSDGQPST